jgi:hypothetical protein
VEAEIGGLQRKVVTSAVRPEELSWGDSGIALRRGRTLPFRVERAWSAPAGVYSEQWFLVQPETREVLYESTLRRTPIWGLQGLTELADEVSSPLDLDPGTYLVVFSLGGVKGGEIEVEAAEPPAEEAA